MRILEALDLVPEEVDLLSAIGGDLLDVGQVVDALAVFENRDKQLSRGEVGKSLCFPGGVWIKNRVRPAVVDNFVKYAKLVGAF